MFSSPSSSAVPLFTPFKPKAAHTPKPLWKYVAENASVAKGGSKKWSCSFCKLHFAGSYPRVRAHLLGIKNQGIQVYCKVSAEERACLTKEDHESAAKKQKSSSDSFNKKRATQPSVEGHGVCNCIIWYEKIRTTLLDKENAKICGQLSDTRFASNFMMLHRLVRVKSPLKQLVTSGEWDQWKKQNDQADTIEKRLLSGDFWEKVEKYVKVLWPVMAMLRVVDRDQPIMGVVYEAIDQMLEQIKEILKEDTDGTLMYEEIRELAQERWDMLHSPLHATNFLLNPILFSKKPYKDKAVMKGWRKTLDRVGRDEAEKTILKAQLLDYISLQGEFEDTSAFGDMQKLSPIAWWQNYGTGALELQRLATRVLFQVSSASTCPCKAWDVLEDGSSWDAFFEDEDEDDKMFPYNAYGEMQAGSSNPMYGNIGVQPGFRCAADSYGMPGANMGMTCFSQPDAQNLNMAGARRGLLLRGGDVLERLAGVTTIIFDKTGTLTVGEPTVSAVGTTGLYEDSAILRLAAAVEQHTWHPIASAISTAAEAAKIELPATSGHLTEPGHGALAEVEGKIIAVGMLEWVDGCCQRKSSDGMADQILSADLANLETQLGEVLAAKLAPKSVSQSMTTVFVGMEGIGVIGAIAVTDTLREEAKETISRLQEMNIDAMVLSGDREEAVASISRSVGIQRVHAGLKPKDKADFIRSLQKQGQSVAMVGDGVNDAPALAAADVGMALKMQKRENAASDAASAILLGNSLSQVVQAVDLSRATIRKVKQNLGWALAYNAVAIPLAAGALLPSFGFTMSPSVAGEALALVCGFVFPDSHLWPGKEACKVVQTT
ncbi:hypothetical protein L7F22_023445 [Adiantum nelumboides]|nr:hypothetical protein [Adiantum nelumboides]